MGQTASRYNSQPRVQQTDSRHQDSQPRVQQTDSRYQDSQPRAQQTDSRYQSTPPRAAPTEFRQPTQPEQATRYQQRPQFYNQNPLALSGEPSSFIQSQTGTRGEFEAEDPKPHKEVLVHPAQEQLKEQQEQLEVVKQLPPRRSFFGSRSSRGGL